MAVRVGSGTAGTAHGGEMDLIGCGLGMPGLWCAPDGMPKRHGAGDTQRRN